MFKFGMCGCDYLINCPFLEENYLTETVSNKYQTDYCLDDFKKCARVKLGQRIGMKHVPIDFRPDEESKIKFLVDDYKKDTH